LALPSDKIGHLQVAVQDQILSNSHEEAMRSAKEALALAQKEGSKASGGVALLSMGQVLRATGKSKDAVTKASEARDMFKKAQGVTGEGVALALIATVHHEQTEEFSYDPGAQKSAYVSSVRAARDAVRCLKEGGGAPLVLAEVQNTYCTLMLLKGDYKAAVPAALDATEIYKAQGDEAGLAESQLNLAESHVLAGANEDYQRQQWFLPMGCYHAAAAGARAEQALQLFQRLGKKDKVGRCKVILEMERVVACSSYRSKPFCYDTWKDQLTTK